MIVCLMLYIKCVGLSMRIPNTNQISLAGKLSERKSRKWATI